MILEEQQLQDYALATHSTLLRCRSDLDDPTSRAQPMMLAWCRQQGSIVVLTDHSILCSNPMSRLVQNCKNIMINNNLTPQKVFAATPALIRVLLENTGIDTEHSCNNTPSSINAQQQQLRTLIKDALALDASHIHFDITQQLASIRLRRHGELIRHAEWLPKIAEQICSIAFNSASDHANSAFNPRIPQHALASLLIDEHTVPLRLASIPTPQGYDVVIHLTASHKPVNNIEQLGYDADQTALLTKAINMPSGLVVIAGTSGAGKTTTLTSCTQLIGRERKIYSVNDAACADMARAALNMDSDAIVIDGIRDKDTAKLMCDAAVTGQLVLSTVHAHSAIDIMACLNNLGISNSLLASPNLMVCLLYQQLVPLLCQRCAVPLPCSKQHRDAIRRWEKTFKQLNRLKARGEHCPHCHHQGIKGRTLIAEIIWLDPQGREHLRKGEFLAWKQHLLQQGWRGYSHRLLTMVANGLCDPLDAEKIIGDIFVDEAASVNY